MQIPGIIVVASALLAANAAHAHDIGNGKVIAQVWCANCHSVDPANQRPANDATPSFAAIAGKKSTTAASLAAFLTTRHGGMPDLTLSRSEIDDVAAYILSLNGAQ
jgi:mono/diheme cytochrome c family protein